MTPNQIQLVQATFAQLVPIATTVADLFYGRLFEIAPHVRPMFPKDRTEQKEQLMGMLRAAVTGLDNLDTLVPAASALGRRHAGYGVKAQHYVLVGSALLWTLEIALAHTFTSEVKDAWASAYILLWTTMTDAANERPMAA
ncbi:nitric oxide dioxygenase [Rhodospirillales bacterium URHD0017]|nr:nitric oxide dioxygenase [Rhodospirillales bacterium URHD0017]